jgi:hypothetical protein
MQLRVVQAQSWPLPSPKQSLSTVVLPWVKTKQSRMQLFVRLCLRHNSPARPTKLQKCHFSFGEGTRSSKTATGIWWGFSGDHGTRLWSRSGPWRSCNWRHTIRYGCSRRRGREFCTRLRQSGFRRGGYAEYGDHNSAIHARTKGRNGQAFLRFHRFTRWIWHLRGSSRSNNLDADWHTY